MPIIAIGVVAYATGLLLGFGGAFAIGVAITLVLALRGTVVRERVTLGAALLMLAGLLVARATVRDDERCLELLERRVAWRVALDEGVQPGAFARGRALDCPADVALSVERGTAFAGDVVLVSGEPGRTSRGLVLVHTTIRSVERGSRLGRWRGEAAVRIDSVFGADAPMARALLVADKTGISTEMKERYAAAGLAHMLAMSGFHMAIIALSLGYAFHLLRLSQRAGRIATLVVVAAYVAVLGAPPGALRAAVMLGAIIASRLWQRPTSPWAILALGALAPFVDPRVVTAIGYQLSVAGVASLIAASALTERIPWLRDAHGLRRRLSHGLVASVLATIVTAPLVGWSFGRLSLIGPLTTLVATPVMALVQPVLFLALLASPVMPAARFLADAAHPLLRAFDTIATIGASVPGGSIAVAPSAIAALLAGAFAVALVVACVSHHVGRPAIVAMSALALLAWAPFAPSTGAVTELHMIDVGQGDAIALHTARGHWVLVDAGRIWRGGDAGRATVVPYVAHRGGTLAGFVLTHPHDDHVGGAATVIHALRPAFYYDAAYTNAGIAYRASLVEARRDGVSWRRVHPGDSLVVDEATITFLGPDSAWTAGLRDANEASTIALVRIGGVRMLLVGDAERGEEDWLLRRDREALHADVLKVGHHGSATSTGDAFLAAVSPRVALVSVGAGNSYGHPSADVMHRLAAAGAEVLRTDRLSTVVVRTDGLGLEIEAGGVRWKVPKR